MSAPLVVNTVDGTVWTRREATRDGLPLYALADCLRCPENVMATYAELEEHGIAGSADALPVPGQEPGAALTAHAASVRLAQYGERTKSWSTATYDSGTQKALHEIAVALDAEVKRLRAERADERDELAAAVGYTSGLAWSDLVGIAATNTTSLVRAERDVRGLRTRVSELEAARKADHETWQHDLRTARGEREAASARVAQLEAERRTTNEALDDAVQALRGRDGWIAELEAAPTTVFRASHESIVFGRYTTAAPAREHCEALVKREQPTAGLDWIEDEDDGVAELVATVDGIEWTTGYVVTELEVASEYDEEADE